MVSEITTSSSGGVCIPLAPSSVKVFTSLFCLFAGEVVISIDEDSASLKGLEQPLVMVCITSTMGRLAFSYGGGEEAALVILRTTLIDELAQPSLANKSFNLVAELEAIFGLMTEVSMIFTVGP